jgi:hypothetical protein
MKKIHRSLCFFAAAFAAGGAFAAVNNIPPNYLSPQALLGIAGDKYASGELPLGDQHYVLDAPRKGYIYLCHKFGDEGAGGAQRAGSWIHGQTWNPQQKPAVQGQVNWPGAFFSVSLNGNVRVLDGNGLPTNHTTGTYPVQSNDPAAAYDRNPNSIQPQQVHEVLPSSPVYTDPPFCMGMEVGYMLDGVPLFNGFDAGLRDAAAHEIQDACDGHPQRGGIYHYHSMSSCIRDKGIETVIGYALDGFPITGPVVAPGKYLTTDDLDVCHGITSEVVVGGRKQVTYHYVMTEDFPYSVSCFRAQPVRIGPAKSLANSAQPEMQQSVQPAMQSGMQSMPPQQGGNPPGGPPRTPPIEALQACSGKSDSESCAFVSPRGDSISGQCHAVPQGAVACVPAGMRGP